MHLKRSLLVVMSVIWSANAAAAATGADAQREGVCAQLKSLYAQKLFERDTNKAIAQHFDEQRKPLSIEACQAAHQAAASTWWKKEGQSKTRRGLFRSILSSFVWTIAGLFGAAHVRDAISGGRHHSAGPIKKTTVAAAITVISFRSACHQLVKIKDNLQALLCGEKHVFKPYYQRELPELKQLNDFSATNDQETLVDRLARLRKSKRKLPAAA